jgi:uncharacterized protein (TIGR02246 family)
MLPLMNAIFGMLLVLLPPHAYAGPAADAGAVIDHWITAFNQDNPDLISALYAPGALLHATTSPQLYIGNEAIRDYFKNFRGNGKNAAVTERHMIVLSDAAVMGVGFYKFDVGLNGQQVPRPARFTFVLTKHDGRWLITHHHSSALPPAPLQ